MADYGTQAELEERVEHGAKRLDRHVPGWAERINLSSLAFPDVDACVLGQLFGSLKAGYESLLPDDAGPGDIDAEHFYGFNGPPILEGWEGMREAWERVIKERRGHRG